MKNREFRSDLQEMWLSRFSKSYPVAEPAPVKIITAGDMIKLTAKFAAGCALAMGAVVLVMMVAL